MSQERILDDSGFPPTFEKEVEMGLEHDGYYVRSTLIANAGLNRRERLNNPSLKEAVLGPTENEEGKMVLKTIIWDDTKMGLQVVDFDFDSGNKDWEKLHDLYRLRSEEGFEIVEFPELNKVVLHKALSS